MKAISPLDSSQSNGSILEHCWNDRKTHKTHDGERYAEEEDLSPCQIR